MYPVGQLSGHLKLMTDIGPARRDTPNFHPEPYWPASPPRSHKRKKDLEISRKSQWSTGHKSASRFVQRQQSANSTQIANNIYAGGAGIINLESHRVWSYNQMLSKIFVDRPNIPACALYSHGSWSAPKNSLRSRTPGTHSRARERAQLEGTRRTLANLFQTLNPTSDDRRA